MEKDITTEARIKEVARRLFHQKGYAATRTRDIADEANVNISLLNYYFRSKEQLFNIIMIESVQDIFSLLKHIINNKSTSISEKIELAVNKYIDTLIANPHLPLFVLSEIRSNAEGFIKKVQVPQSMIYRSHMFSQLQEQIDKENLPTTPIHVIVNIAAMSVMPIAAKELLEYLTEMPDNTYHQFIEERRRLIPIWVKGSLKIKD